MDNGGTRWPTNDWIPSLATMFKIICRFPSDTLPFRRTPVDLTSRAIVELALGEGGVDASDDDQHSLKIFNVVNPTLTEWTVLAEALQKRLEKGQGERSCR